MIQIAARQPVRLTPAEETAAKTSTARLSIFVAAFLIVLKATTGYFTGSISVWASFLDSTMDIFASTINFVAVRAAARPPDEEHTYGHGKAESLAGLFQAAVITASGIYLIYEAINKLVKPPETKFEWFGAAAMFAALASSTGLVVKLRRTARITDSPALRSEAVHYASDIYTNAGALIALLIAGLTGWKVADPLISMAISLYILWFAVDVARSSIDTLIDRRLPTDVDEKVAQIVGQYRDEGVLGFHALRTRSSGSYKFIEFHLEVDRSKKFEEAHAITVSVIRKIEAEIQRARVQIHTDPAG